MIRNKIVFFGFKSAAVRNINPSSTTINISYQIASTGSITVDVTPNTMNTTSTRYDTGDGIFVKITSGATATGDFTLTVEALTANPSTTNSRSMKITITDNLGVAASKDITITQMASPA